MYVFSTVILKAIRAGVGWVWLARLNGFKYLSNLVMMHVCTVDALIKAPLKNNYDLQKRPVWSAKNYFGPLGAHCLERRL